ncbi:MAG: ATP-binding protein [Magnetococcales bacterium]|nr:ATP-binding protein [Magnetococcales bacterium]
MAEKSNGTPAPLKNVAFFMEMMERLQGRASHMEGIGCFYGEPGLGKSISARFALLQFQAYYIEAGKSWTAKALFTRILREMGITPAKTIWEMTEQAGNQLLLSGRPLIIDEFDKLVDKGLAEHVRELYLASKGKATIIVVGEESLPFKLKKTPRFYDRVLTWYRARPADGEDVKNLHHFYQGEVTIHADMLNTIAEASGGVVRRVCNALETIENWSKLSGVKEIGLSEWGDQPLFTCDPDLGR